VAAAEAVVIEALLDRDLVPDSVVRLGIRRIVTARLREQQKGGSDGQGRRFAALLEWLRTQPIAVATDAANAQHYELPPAFFERVLGRHVKYSSAWWPAGVAALADAEAQMLELTTRRAQIADGHHILELGCGWGSLTLYLARRYPSSAILAVSNSAPQRDYIVAKARAHALANVTVVTADINDFDPGRRFERIVSVEMLEHVRNYPALFARVRDWLTVDGRFFAHVFAHRQFAYPYESRGESDWMARHFFTGGMMPSHELFLRLEDDLLVDRHWRFDGTHYQKTAEAWLQNFDRNRAAIDPVLAAVYGRDEVVRWAGRWRVFFMACAEMFGYRDGHEWGVSHYRFRRREL
jgi:cyclopropane-fatty-acyl-phospholipid synthase